MLIWLLNPIGASLDYGGKDSKNKCSDALYVLHTVRKEWNRPMIQGVLPAPRHSHSACVIGTTMFVFGGQFNGYYLNDIAAFDMKSCKCSWLHITFGLLEGDGPRRLTKARSLLQISR